MPSTVTLFQFCQKRRQDAKGLYLWTRQKHMQFLYVKIVAARRDYKRNTRAILVTKKYVVFPEKNLFRNLINS